MPERVFVVGVGMTDFVKPSSRPDWDYPEMAREAGEQALGDAGIPYERVEHVADHVLIEAKPRHIDPVVKRFELLHRPPRHRAEVAPTDRAVVVESHEGTPAVGDDRMRGGHR